MEMAQTPVYIKIQNVFTSNITYEKQGTEQRTADDHLKVLKLAVYLECGLPWGFRVYALAPSRDTYIHCTKVNTIRLKKEVVFQIKPYLH